MKKIYLSVMALTVGVFASAQVNMSFEDWTTAASGGATSEAADWGYPFISGADTSSANMLPLVLTGATITPTTVSEEITTGASDGNSYVSLTTFTLSGSTNGNFPDGDYPSALAQTFNSTDKYEDFTFDIKHNLQTNDTALFVVTAYDAGGNAIGQSYNQYFGTAVTTWSNETATMNYFTGDPVASYEIIISSSQGQLYTMDPAIPNSNVEIDNIQLGTIIQEAPNASNVVATDISDNGNGTDLEVTFDASSPETNVANYYAVVVRSGDEGLVSQVGGFNFAFIQAYGVQIPANGSASYSTVFAAPKDSVWFNDGGTLGVELIQENTAYKVVIVAEGQNGFEPAYGATSNEITLTSAGSIADQWKNNFNVYPNPTTNNVTFDFAGTTEVKAVTIMNVNGAVVKNIAVNGQSKVNANISDLASGLYIYQVISNENKAVITNKIMKK